MHAAVLLHKAYLIDIDDIGAVAAHHRCTLKALLNSSCAATEHIGHDSLIVLIVHLNIVILRFKIVERIRVNG